MDSSNAVGLTKYTARDHGESFRLGQKSLMNTKIYNYTWGVVVDTNLSDKGRSPLHVGLGVKEGHSKEITQEGRKAMLTALSLAEARETNPSQARQLDHEESKHQSTDGNKAERRMEQKQHRKK